MANILSEIVNISPRMTQRGTITGYTVELRHSGLSEVRTVGDRDRDTAIRKAQALCAKWDEKWARVQEQSSAQQHKKASKDEADERTSAAEQDFVDAENLLRVAIGARIDLREAKMLNQLAK